MGIRCRLQTIVSRKTSMKRRAVLLSGFLEVATDFGDADVFWLE